MVYDFSELKKKLPEIREWLRKELSLLRTGRASPALLDNISINYYGTKTPVKHAGTISVEDARTLRIKPWDASLVPQIEQGIRLAGMGLSPVADKDSLRVVFPELTEERRKSLLKVLSEKLEEARIKMRKLRDEWRSDIQNEERQGNISEDAKYRSEEELQELINAAGKELDEIAEVKRKEILG